MNIEWNCGGGDTVALVSGDSLGKVPDSHVDLLTAEVRQAFRDPPAFFADVANRCPFADLQRYLRLLIDDSDWELRLHTNGYDEPGIAAFAFVTDRVEEAELSPGQGIVPVASPLAIAEFYSLVDWMHWSVYGGAGGLRRGQTHDRLAEMPLELCGDKVEPNATFIWGSTGCGDMFIYTEDGRAGMVSHETGFVHLIGSVADTVNWVCRKLIERTTPEFDYAWTK